MTSPGQRRRVFAREEKAKLERQQVEQPDQPHSEHDEMLEAVDAEIEAKHEDKSAAPPATPNVPASERLELPKGAMLAYRKSGGLRFTSHEIVVYPDGRVTYEGGDTAKTALESRARRKMTDAQIVRIRKLLDQVNFWRLGPTPGDQSPDSYAYEIVARVGSKHNHVELFDGAIPDALQSLIDQMNRLMPGDDA